jgi:hypothetical protein
LKFRERRFLSGFLLAVNGVASAGVVYLSIQIGGSVRGFVGAFGLKAGAPLLAWDDWYFVAISVTSLTAAVGTLLHKDWGKASGLIALAASGIWAVTMLIAPQSWFGVRFSFWVDRWAAALIMVLAFSSFMWLAPSNASAEFKHHEISAQ